MSAPMQLVSVPEQLVSATEQLRKLRGSWYVFGNTYKSPVAVMSLLEHLYVFRSTYKSYVRVGRCRFFKG